MKTKNQTLLQDVFYHLKNFKIAFANFKIEFNRNPHIIYAMDKFINEIELIEKIIRSYDNLNFKSVSNEINVMLFNDQELHGVIVIIKKKKFLNNIDMTKCGKIIHEI